MTDPLREALEKVEWVQQFSNSRAECPWCGAYREDGHRKSCPRQEALAAPVATGLRERIAAIPWNVAGQASNPVGGCDEEWAVNEYRDAVLAALAARSEVQPDELDWPTLANVIREVDGNHDLGAGELAERILAHPKVRAALAATPSSQGGEPCWFCQRKVGIDYLIAGYDTFDEQRLACLDCDRAIKALYEKGWLGATQPAPHDEPRDFLGELSDEDVMYDHPVAQSGEPMDPVLFVRWDAIKEHGFRLAATPSSQGDGHGHTGNDTFCQVCVNAGATTLDLYPEEAER